jgi:acyl-CoA synthetase (NDP forming)
MDILRRGARRGVKYRNVVTMGDAADLGPADLLPWLLDDPETKVIGLYMEDAPSGRALFEALQAAKGRKPVVLLVGGRTSAGARAAASHTGALASDGRVWAGIAKQTAAALVDTLDDFIDALLACQSFTPRYGAPTKRVVLFGNGGGAGVLAADGFHRAGLEIGPLDDEAAGNLAAIDLPAGASAANPIDVPGNILQRDNGRFGVQVVASALAGDNWDAFVMHMNVPGLLTYEHVDILGPLIEAGMQAASKGGGHVALVLRSDGEPAVEVKKQAYAAQALAAGAAVFNELDDAARALTALAAIEAV